MHVFGHRGSPGFPRHAENTMASFRRAVQDGADGLEFDVRRCADGQLVVIHDDTVNRTTNGIGLVSALSYSQLRTLNAGDGESIPRLADVLGEFPTHRLNIELKETGLTADMAKLAASLASQVVVSGFQPFWEELRTLSSQFETGLLATSADVQKVGVEAVVLHARRIGARALHLPQEVVDRALVGAAHDSALAVRVFTVNEPKHVERCLWHGVDAVFSDVPGLVLEVIRHAER